MLRALNLQDLKMTDHEKNIYWKLQYMYLKNEGPNRTLSSEYYYYLL